MTTLLIATSNTHKVQEISQILSCTSLSLKDIPNFPPVIEDAPTFEGNARKKALQLTTWVRAHGLRSTPIPPAGIAILADDSGLEVDALGGQPGVRSARFAASPDQPDANCSDAANNAKLLRLLENVPTEKRTARFRCVLALASLPANPQADIPITIVNGTCEGRIAFTPAGEGGFGYDPLFIPDGYDRSFAQLGAEIKNTLSHRARAVQNLRRQIEQFTQI